jgi:5-methylcytosine-specific restriction endonuclease McrA
MVMEYERVKFGDAYAVAEDIRLVVVENPEGETLEKYFSTDDIDTLRRFAAPQRWTLLHQFIQERFVEFRLEGFEYYRDDMFDLVVREYEAILKGYEVPYNGFEMPNEMADDYEEKTHQHIVYLRCLLPIERIVDDTFQLLFGDREFLLNFQKIVANVVRQMRKDEHPHLLVRDGAIRRTRLPTWVKRGVFYRDRGRCINCGKDLTGTVVTGEEVHYDHITPLAEGGTNDPTNFQLLCRGCNLSKARGIITSDRYPVYWRLR